MINIVEVINYDTPSSHEVWFPQIRVSLPTKVVEPLQTATIKGHAFEAQTKDKVPADAAGKIAKIGVFHLGPRSPEIAIFGVAAAVDDGNWEGGQTSDFDDFVISVRGLLKSSNDGASTENLVEPICIMNSKSSCSM